MKPRDTRPSPIAREDTPKAPLWLILKDIKPEQTGGNKKPEGNHQKDRSRLAVAQSELLFYGGQEGGEDDPADKGQ